ncbi:MAG: type II toxin-antitoxin system RelE/ParE family toxin [Anaerolineae bacterium]
MAYQLKIIRRAYKELRKLPPDITRRLRDAINDLAGDPHPRGCQKLRGGVGYAIRVGSYRVVYDIDDDARVVTVLRAGHRKSVYRSL